MQTSVGVSYTYNTVFQEIKYQSLPLTLRTTNIYPIPFPFQFLFRFEKKMFEAQPESAIMQLARVERARIEHRFVTGVKGQDRIILELEMGIASLPNSQAAEGFKTEQIYGTRENRVQNSKNRKAGRNSKITICP